MKKFIIGLDGMDRTGKSTIGLTGNSATRQEFHRRLGKNVMVYNGHENRYSVSAKACFKDRMNGLSAIVSSGVAIAELLEAIEIMHEFDADGLVMPRTFASSLVYMCMRGDYDDARSLRRDVEKILEKFDIGFCGIYFRISEQAMINRGSAIDSYEIVNYEKTFSSMSYAVRKFQVPRTHLEIASVDGLTIEQTLETVIDRSKQYLDLGGSDMDLREYGRNYVNYE